MLDAGRLSEHTTEETMRHSAIYHGCCQKSIAHAEELARLRADLTKQLHFKMLLQTHYKGNINAPQCNIAEKSVANAETHVKNRLRVELEDRAVAAKYIICLISSYQNVSFYY